MPEQIRPYGPGKFATQVDAYTYEISQEGLNDEFTTEDGSWLGLLKANALTPLYDPSVPTNTELNEAEQRFLRSKAGVILEENGDGVLTANYFEHIEDLDAAWEALRDTRAEVASEEDMDSSALPEIPEDAPITLEVTPDMLQQAEGEGRKDVSLGAKRGSAPSLARIDGWRSAYGYQEGRDKEMGLLMDAWRRGVYLQLRDNGQL